MIKKLNNLDKYTKLAIIIIVIGILIRFSLVSIYAVSGDACWQLSNSRFIAENNKLPLFEFFGRDEPFWPPPLFHIVTALVYKVFINFNEGAADFATKMVSPILGSLTLIFSFLIAKMLFNKKKAFYSLIFLTFIPLSIDYSVFSYIDGMVTFLAVLSVYLALKNKTMLSSITAGLAILTKYNGIFILPVLLFIIYMNYKGNVRTLMKNAAIVSIIPIAIGSIWFIRNWIYLGNPVWPFMNSIFHGIEVKTFVESGVGAVNLLKVFSIDAITSIYLGIFGVPNGNIGTLNFLEIPYLNLFFNLWFLGTIIFSVPLFMGVASKNLNYKGLLFVWIGSYLILILLYIVNASWSVSRFMLPAFPAIAMIWAHGLEKIKFKSSRNIFRIILILIIVGFTSTSILKISLAANLWDSYSNDFEWIRQNTNKNDIFLSGSQCISYYIARQTVKPEIENLESANYAFVNQDFKVDRLCMLNNEMLSEIKTKGKIIYRNEETKTEAYKFR